MNIQQKAIKAGMWSAIQNSGSQVGSAIVFLLLARLLKPADFGLAALASVFLAFMEILLRQGFAQALIQKQKLAPEDINTAFWTNLGIGTSLTAISWFLAPLVAIFFKQPQLTPIVQTLSALFTIASLSNVQQALLERKFAFKAIAIRSLVGTTIGGIVGIVLAVRGFAVWSLVYQQLTAETLGAIVLWKASDWRPQWQYSIESLRSLSSFGISILGFSFLDFLNKRADDFLIGYFLGAVALGYYTIAYRILTVMTQLLIQTTSSVAMPTFSRLQEDREMLRRAFYKATQLTSLVAFPAFLGTLVLAPELIRVAFGEKWLASVPVMQMLSLVGMLRTVAYFKGSVFMAMGKPAWRLWLGLLGTGLNLVAFSIAVRWGIVAVATAYFISGCIVVPIGQWAIMKLLEISVLDYVRQFIAPLLGSAIMAIAIVLTKQLLGTYLNPLILLATCWGVALLAYGLTLRFGAPQLWKTLWELGSLALSRSKHQNT
jgi:O-antigen/teichoic acid export membrane protein